ncbi:MAG: tetratricopeptide repeat protein [Desulfomonilia bacterium]
MARMTRKDLLNTPDEFVTTTNSVLVWIKEHPQQFIIGAVVLVGILAGGYGFYYWKTTRELDGMNAYLKAADNSQMTLQVAQDYSDTKAGKLAKLRLARMSFNQGNQKMAQSYADEFINKWGSKDTFHWQAVLILADTYIQQKEQAKALPLLDTCIENASKDLKDQALILKAGALITLGKENEARKSLGSVSDNYREIANILLASLGPLPAAKLNAKQ